MFELIDAIEQAIRNDNKASALASLNTLRTAFKDFVKISEHYLKLKNSLKFKIGNWEGTLSELDKSSVEVQPEEEKKIPKTKSFNLGLGSGRRKKRKNL